MNFRVSRMFSGRGESGFNSTGPEVTAQNKASSFQGSKKGSVLKKARFQFRMVSELKIRLKIKGSLQVRPWGYQRAVTGGVMGGILHVPQSRGVRLGLPMQTEVTWAGRNGETDPQSLFKKIGPTVQALIIFPEAGLIKAKEDTSVLHRVIAAKVGGV